MSSDPFDLIGQIVGGQFRVDALAGDADLSIVYKGHRLDSNTTVAIKCLHLPETIPDALAKALDAAFHQAFRVHDRLARGHENIAQTLTSGETHSQRTGASVAYLVREWLDGESLAAELEGRKRNARPARPLDETLGLLQGAFEAVAFAHTEGEVHLGLNPGNLFVAKRADGTATLKVLDFGLARMMNDFSPESPSDSHSGCGLRLWLPGYAAPEQLDETLGAVGTQTDVYTLALIAMEALSGHKLPVVLEQALNRALAGAPGARQADAGELWRQMTSSVRPRAASAAVLPSASSTGSPVTVPVAPETPQPTPSSPPGVPLSSAPAAQEPTMMQRAESHEALLIEPNATPSLVPPVLALSTPPPPPKDASLAGSGRPARRALAVVASAAAVAVLIVVGTVAVRRPHRASASLASAAAEGQGTTAAPPADMPSAHASPPAAAAAASSPDGPAAAASDSTSRPQPPFAVAAARRALEKKKHDLGKCRRGRVYGHASATVTFANDGSVDRVAVGPPLAGTPAGDCAAEALSSVHVAPFSGDPGSVSFKFNVPR
jgi:serine/threonine protein kinase